MFNPLLLLMISKWRRYTAQATNMHLWKKHVEGSPLSQMSVIDAHLLKSFDKNLSSVCFKLIRNDSHSSYHIGGKSIIYHIAVLIFQSTLNFEFPANDSKLKFRYIKTEDSIMKIIIFALTRPHFLCNCKHCDKSYETHRKRTCNSKRWLCNNSCLNTKMAW